MKRRTAAVALLSLAACAAAAAATPLEKFLRHVPDDAAIVVVMPSPDALIEGVLAFAKAASIPDVDASTKDMLDDMGFIDAVTDAAILETDGPLLIVARAEFDEPIVMIGVKSTDAQPTTASSTAHIVDQILIVAPTAERLEAAVSGSAKRAAAIGEAFGSLDDCRVAVFADLDALEEPIDEAFMTIEGVIAMAGVNPQAQGMMPMMRVFLDGLRSLVSDSTIVVLHGSIDGSGVTLNKTVSFAPDSDMAHYLAEVKASDKPLLRGVNAKNAPMVFGAEWSVPPSQPSLSERMGEAMIKAIDDGSPEIAEMREALSLYRRITGLSGVVGTGDDGKLSIRECVFTDDPDAVLQPTLKLSTATNRMMAAMNMGMTVQVETGMEEIASRKVSYVDTHFQIEDEAAKAVISAMYGDVVRAYYYSDENGLRMVAGPAESARRLLENELAGDVPVVLGDARVEAGVARLSKSPQAIALVDYVQLVSAFAKMMPEIGAMLPQRAPPKDTPYIAWGLYLTDGRVRAELVVPAAAVKAGIELFEQPSTGSASVNE